MIVSASRRTDIPAFYSRWFINRVRAGYCTVPNPFNLNQVSRISLAPQEVDVISFWTRNARPFFPYLEELDQRGCRFYFLYTLLDYPHQIDPFSPAAAQAVRTFRELVERIGPQRVIWRYDPILFTQQTGPDFHIDTYRRLAEALRGYTQRSVISFMTHYSKAQPRLQEMARHGAALTPFRGPAETWFGGFVRSLVNSAAENDMTIQSCASELDLAPYGVLPGKCVDDEYIQDVFGIEVAHQKDPGQRKLCGCVRSRDIGMYDSCLFGCQYCYATTNFERSRQNYREHDPQSPSLVGWYDVDEELQLRLWG